MHFLKNIFLFTKVIMFLFNDGQVCFVFSSWKHTCRLSVNTMIELNIKYKENFRLKEISRPNSLEISSIDCFLYSKKVGKSIWHTALTRRDSKHLPQLGTGWVPHQAAMTAASTQNPKQYHHLIYLSGYTVLSSVVLEQYLFLFFKLSCLKVVYTSFFNTAV